MDFAIVYGIETFYTGAKGGKNSMTKEKITISNSVLKVIFLESLQN